MRWASNQSAMVDVVLEEVGPAVPGAFLDDELGLDPGGLELVQEQLGLLDRNKVIGVAVDDQRGRVIGGHVIHRTDLAGDFEDFRLVGDRPGDMSFGVLTSLKSNGALNPSRIPRPTAFSPGLP